MAPQPDAQEKTAGVIPRRLCFYTAGFLRDRRVRRILQLKGHDLALGRPDPEDGVVVWGHSPYARRGEKMAARYNAPLIRVEDAFLRSVRPGRQGDAPLGLIIDPLGVHFDSGVPSLVEYHLTHDPLDNSNLLGRAKAGIDRLIASDLSKYNIHRTELAAPPPGYVLVIDQTLGDASISYGGASAAHFAEMLVAAQTEHPQARILIKTHPETALGLRGGHFSPKDQSDRVSLITDPVSPWKLLEGAIAVYTVSSQMGFEAILAGHRPHVFGQPFYAGWGLSEDRNPIPRRNRKLTRAQLFAAAMILAPTWYDPCRDRLCSFEEVLSQLEAKVRAFREDRKGHVALGMRMWKRGRMQAFFGGEKPLVFAKNAAQASEIAKKSGRTLLAWGSTPALSEDSPVPLMRVEDGFLRSRGLGAELVPPLSLITDDQGIYFDPEHPSRLEKLIQTKLSPAAEDRAAQLRERLLTLGLSKYNLAGSVPDLPEGHRILVPGQVENDASIEKGAGDVRTNLGLIEAVRIANPKAVLVYKPHPDVEAGLRPGRISDAALKGLADIVAHRANPVDLIMACDEVWTMTSLLGFEALIRGKPVTCLGAPFYAGWGLTTDLGPIPKRRLRRPDGSPAHRPSLNALIHAALIAYPRYYDPVSKRPCPPEVALERLAAGDIPHPGRLNRLLSKLQGRFATHARLWRQ